MTKCCQIIIIDEHEEERIFNELEENVAIFVSLRYSFRGKVPKNFNWYDETLPNLDDDRFRMLLRCSRKQFNVLLALIENHPVFHGFNSHKQFTTQFQLALVLYRLGSYGEGATLCKIASLFGIGDGGTIEKITSRIFKSILSLENQFLAWPTNEERKQMVLATLGELPYCIGYVDGSDIRLQERPTHKCDPTSYYSRKKEYAIKLQAVCDYTLKFRHILVGYPGSVHDARIYNNCRLTTHPRDYFSEPEYVAGDSAYKLTTTVITPFRLNSTVLQSKQRASFNRFFSSKRVRIEHGFGVMKEKLPSLKCLSIKIKDPQSHKFACTWIRVCCILHNILLPHYDQQDLSLLSQGGNYNSSYEVHEHLDEDDEDGEAKRVALVQIISARGDENLI